jgi:hypothetical protein
MGYNAKGHTAKSQTKTKENQAQKENGQKLQDKGVWQDKVLLGSVVRTMDTLQLDTKGLTSLPPISKHKREKEEIQMKAEVTEYPMGNWLKGTIEEYRFTAKVFNEASEFGIKHGNVSKLFIGNDRLTIASYDRGWIKRPTRKYKEHYDTVMKFLEGFRWETVGEKDEIL